jgi:hypothetical protein
MCSANRPTELKLSGMNFNADLNLRKKKSDAIIEQEHTIIVARICLFFLFKLCIMYNAFYVFRAFMTSIDRTIIKK